MSLTYTPLGTLGTKLPKFKLTSIQGKSFANTDFNQNILWIMFICNHCPYVQAIENRISQLADECLKKDVGVVAICSNNPTISPQDNVEHLKKQTQRAQFNFEYLVDLNAQAAQAFGAVCTPDFFVYDHEVLAYRGQFDDNWSEENKVRDHSLKKAIKQLLAGQVLDVNKQKPSLGCSIKR